MQTRRPRETPFKSTLTPRPASPPPHALPPQHPRAHRGRRQAVPRRRLTRATTYKQTGFRFINFRPSAVTAMTRRRRPLARRTWVIFASDSIRKHQRHGAATTGCAECPREEGSGGECVLCGVRECACACLLPLPSVKGSGRRGGGVLGTLVG